MNRRILSAVLLVTALAIAAFFVPAALAIRSAQQREDLLTLQREASIVATRVPADGPIDEAALESIVSSEHLLGLYSPDGRLVAGAGPDSADRIVAIALAGNFAEGRVGGDLVAAVPVRALVDGSSFVMRIESPAAEGRARFVRSLVRLGAAAIVIFLVAAAVGTWLARRLSRPVDELRWWASDPSPDRTPPPPTGVAELDSLRSDLIADRARIAELLRRERSFSSHVSHQLRTPVSAMRVAVETELAAPRTDPTELLEEALGQLDRLESTITSLLALARHGVEPSQWVELGDLVGEHLERARSSEAAREVVLHSTPARVLTDPAAVGHVLDVLVDNAVRHGRGTITASVRADGTHAVVEIADQGSTPLPADVFSDSATDAGHGIGLRLARSLTESIGGVLELLDGPTTTFRLTLPTGDDGGTAPAR